MISPPEKFTSQSLLTCTFKAPVYLREMLFLLCKFPKSLSLPPLILNIFAFITVLPQVSLHPGPLIVVEGSDVVFPTCHVTGFPQPVISWSKSFGQLPHERVKFNNSVIKLLDVRKVDSDSYVYTASNLLGNVVRKTLLVVVPLSQFTIKPPVKTVAASGNTFTLNCSAGGDPEPVHFLFQNESTCAIHVKMCSTFASIFMQIRFIFI